MKRTLQNYKSGIKPVWCPGCGDYAILRAIQQAFLDLDTPPEDIAVVSGIGCSGRLSHYMNTYSLHGTHGRAVHTALGVKTARPELTVMAVGGDGDGPGIGGGHIPHAARKNVDMTYLLIDNRIYGLTKGQTSPTTPVGRSTTTSPDGVTEPPVDVIPVFLSYDVSFVAQTSSLNIPEMTDIIKQAIRHKGFSIVHIFSICKTFPVIEADALKDLLQPLPEDHPRSDKMEAMKRGYSQDHLYTGIFYQVEKPTLDQQQDARIELSCSFEQGEPTANIEDLLLRYV